MFWNQQGSKDFVSTASGHPATESLSASEADFGAWAIFITAANQLKEKGDLIWLIFIAHSWNLS